MRIPDSKTASKSDVAHSCALRTCVNFADRKFVAVRWRTFNAHAKNFLATSTDWISVELPLNMKESRQSSISLESSWHKEGNDANQNERMLCKIERAYSLMSEHAYTWASLTQRVNLLLYWASLLKTDGFSEKIDLIFFYLSKLAQKWASLLKQVTQGHNIVADRWAGASNHHPHLMRPPPLTHIPIKHLKRLFFHFSTRSSRTDRRTDRRTKPLIELRVHN